MNTAPERRLAAVMYAELRNFTRLSEVLQADRVLALTNEFFALAANAAQANDGIVVSVHNDSVLAAFDAGSAEEFAAKRAQGGGGGSRGQFGAIGERWKIEYGLPAAVSLGVHIGETVFGMAGAPASQQFTALGDCVSIAERLHAPRARRRDRHLARRDEGAARQGRGPRRRKSCRCSSSAASARRCRFTAWCSRRGWTLLEHKRRRAGTYSWSISMFCLVPLLEMETMIPRPARITRPITIQLVSMFSRKPSFPQRGKNATDEQGKSQKIHSCPFHGAPPERRPAPRLLDAPWPWTVPC